MVLSLIGISQKHLRSYGIKGAVSSIWESLVAYMKKRGNG